MRDEIDKAGRNDFRTNSQRLYKISLKALESHDLSHTLNWMPWWLQPSMHAIAMTPEINSKTFLTLLFPAGLNMPSFQFQVFVERI